MRVRFFAALCFVLLVAVSAPAAQARLGLTIGFNGQSQLTGGDPTTGAVWLRRAVNEGAGIVRVNVTWSQVAPAKPPTGFVPADPASPGYDWTDVDTAVRALSSHGLQVLLTLLSAPAWAEGANQPSSAVAGTRRPDPRKFASFATAAARRYSGSFPDPLDPGAFLPRVRYWQAWNEPNLSVFLTPQWIAAGGGQFMAESPIIYRQLLNAFYAAVKQVSASNFVVTAGTAPYGDPPGGDRVPPVEFDRDLFCLQHDAQLTPLPCPDPPHLDALSHHPYGIGGPLWHALNPDDAAVPDLYKIANVLQAAERAHTVLPAGQKRLWDTEVSWDSSPPDPEGIPIERQARWVEQTMYVLWSQGVDTVLWLQIVDSPPIPSYGATNQGGMYYLDGQAKPAAQALQFPFVTQRRNRRHLQAWGRAPVAGRLKIEVRHGRRWKIVSKIRVKKQQVFLVRLGIRGRAVLRAEVGGQTSLTWKQGP